MDFFDKIGKKASEAYKVTADKTGKLAKDTKIKIKIGDLRSKINDIYEEIGKKVYEKHVSDEEVAGIDEEINEKCAKIDEISEEIENLLKESRRLRDKKQCPECYSELDRDVNYCPNCGKKQEIPEPVVVDENIEEKEEEKEEEAKEPEIIESDDVNNEQDVAETDDTEEVSE